MKFRNLLFTTLCTLLIGATFTSCSDDDDPSLVDDGSVIELPGRRAFILNQGKMGSNNAGIAFFAPNKDADFIGDIYQLQNKARLGDLANDIEEYDDHLYVIVSKSKYIARLNSAGVETNRYQFPTTEGDPRCMVVEDGYVYVAQYGGQVCKLDAKTLNVVATFKGGDNLDGIEEEDGKLYVSNTYRRNADNKTEYNEEVFVIDTKSMKLIKSLPVVCNPNGMTEVDDKIFLISVGNYADIQSSLQIIDPRTDKVTDTKINVSKITEGHNGLIYAVNAAYDANWNMTNTFFSYNPATGTVNNNSFLKDAPEEFKTAAIYLMQVDPETEDIYIATSDYVNTGTIYRFNKEGYLQESFDTGGVNPAELVFID